MLSIYKFFRKVWIDKYIYIAPASPNANLAVALYFIHNQYFICAPPGLYTNSLLCLLLLYGSYIMYWYGGLRCENSRGQESINERYLQLVIIARWRPCFVYGWCSRGTAIRKARVQNTWCEYQEFLLISGFSSQS